MFCPTWTSPRRSFVKGYFLGSQNITVKLHPGSQEDTELGKKGVKFSYKGRATTSSGPCLWSRALDSLLFLHGWGEPYSKIGTQKDFSFTSNFRGTVQRRQWEGWYNSMSNGGFPRAGSDEKKAVLLQALRHLAHAPNLPPLSCF